MQGSMLLRAAGLLAVAGGIANGVADYMLQGGPKPSPGLNTYAQLADAPFDPVFLGSIIGNATIPFWLLGFWPVYVALKPAGRSLALPPVLLLAYGFSMFAGYHGSYALYAAGFQAQAAAPPDAAPVLAEMVARMHAYHEALIDVITIGVPLGSLWLAAVILFRETHYRRWMVILTPLVAPLTQPFAEMLPAPIGGYIRPPWGTTIYTVFFLVSTLVTWNVSPDGDGETAGGG